MEQFELDKLRASELKTFTYQETEKVVEKLEEVFQKNFTEVYITENFDTYRAYADIIITRTKNNEFEELTTEEKIRFQTKVEAISFNLLSIVKINNLAQERVQDGVNKVINAQRKIGLSLKKHRDGILKKFDEKGAEISALEHTTLSHVLSLMGVFSAIITIIMSVVLTATSWLNNADGASAIIAFVVPNLVALFAVVVLLSFIFLYNNRHIFENADVRDKSQIIKNFSKKIKYVFAHFVLVFVLIISILLTVIILAKTKSISKTHTQYIISPSEYEVEEEIISGNEAVSYYVFVLDDIRYKFECKEEYLHNGNLYFCKEHNSLE